MKKSCWIKGKFYEVEFPWDERLKDQIKEIPGRMWCSDIRRWRIPVSIVAAEMLARLGFQVPKATPSGLDLGFLDGMGLRPYQVEGIERMAGELGLTGYFGDEMGLGKTAQAICSVRARGKAALPCLAVCPGSLKANWEREIGIWFPDASVQVLRGRAKKDSSFTADADFTVINYDILASWAPLLAGRHKTIILDECHRIKDPKAQWSKAAMKLAMKCANRICLSGTPITSRPMDFFNTLKIIAPSIFPNRLKFGMRYCGPQPNPWARCGYDFKGASNMEELNKLAKSFMIRRLKKDVLKDLPEKRRIVIPVEIDLRAYGKVERAAMAMGMDGESAFAGIEMCKQAARDGKMEAVIEFIRDFLESGRKLVVFATHTATLDRLENEFPDCARIDGKVPTEKRGAIVDRFQKAPACRLFIGNLQAAGTGLTLTAASSTLTIELGWVPGDHAQAEDRVHRLGQAADSVEAYYMVAQGTIEEAIMNVLDSKKDDISQVVDGTEIDPRELLAPLMAKYNSGRAARPGRAPGRPPRAA